MWRWRRVAVARVFALVVRCRVMRLLLYSRVGKNRDTRREPPDGTVRGSRPAKLTKRCFIRYLSAGRKAIAYTDLLGNVYYSTLSIVTSLQIMRYLSFVVLLLTSITTSTRIPVSHSGPSLLIFVSLYSGIF